jgi:uncharacterized protein YndB with AHSA1/START domain
MTEPLTAADPGTIEREIRIDARPETVFPYFVDPERMVRWMGRTAELDATPGGTFRIDYNGEDIARGTYVEIDSPRRIVFTWGWEAPGDATPPGASTVEVTLTPDGDGGTLLHLRHSGLPVEAVEGHAIGWDQFLPNLVAAAVATSA